MEDTLATKKEGAKVKEGTRSYRRYKRVEKAINDASGNGRCWWIKRFLKNTIRY
tara:strand:+ start:205 stop:366 length:162 start_codon:yes stop_codon:yes gene_type:complete